MAARKKINKNVEINSYNDLSEQGKIDIVMDSLPALMDTGDFWVTCIKCNMIQSIPEVKKRKCNQCGKIKPADLEVTNASKDIN